MSGILINGISGMNLGHLPQGATKKVPLTLFPLKPGIQKITGIRISELQTERKFDFDDLMDIFVGI